MDALKITSDTRLQSAPELTSFDYGLAIAKVAVLAFPFLGPGVTLFDLVTAPLRGKRMSGWCEDIRLAFNELSQKVEGLTPESLATNEAFISAFAQATQAALRAHQKEKLDALRNAVVNVALGHEPDTDRQQQFLALVDRFSATHLVLLRFFKDPASYFQSTGKSVPMIHLPTVQPTRKLLVHQLVIDAMPSLSEHLKSPIPDRSAASFQFIESILGDLVFAKLIELDRLNDTWSVPKFDQNPAPSPIKPLNTHLGEDFLAFITEPREEAHL